MECVKEINEVSDDALDPDLADINDGLNEEERMICNCKFSVYWKSIECRSNLGKRDDENATAKKQTTYLVPLINLK